jgi:hypothetical protein
MVQAGEAGDNVSFKKEAGNGTGMRDRREAKFQIRAR